MNARRQEADQRNGKGHFKQIWALEVSRLGTPNKLCILLVLKPWQ